ncbi:MAG: peptidoglycan DD-metalloendopeptidase family protein [bacterium]|nr:peptidoglycan DD-metalloendopeptidase family protein [bacterium]
MFKELVQSRVIPVLSIILGSMFLASCSSGVSRFDFPMFGLSSTDDNDSSTFSLPLAPTIEPSANDLTRYSSDSGLAGFEKDRGASSVAGSSTNYNTRSSYLPAQTAAPEVRAARYGAVNRAPVSNAKEQYSRNMRPHARKPSRYDAAPMKPIIEAKRSFLPSEPRGYNYNSQPKIKLRAAHDIRTSNRPVKATSKSADGSSSMTVSSGDTLYSIGRRHNVSIVELMEMNGLVDSNLTVGQRLTVPGGARQTIARSSQADAATRVKARTSGTYTVRPGERFANIAKKHGVSSAQLADVNGVTDPGSIRAGEVLILPTRANPVRNMKKAVKLSPKQPSELKVRKVKTQAINLGFSKKSPSATVIKQQSVAMKKPSKKGAVSTAFRWPVRGRIIGKFGPRTDGTHNDGINLAVPNGTKVKAAESGVVAYVGSELEGYGNLILIRHSNDWVSAYAHNDKLIVKRGEKIKRGQIIARAGTSGSVEVPQVHFELRKGSKPVDPTSFMAGT